MEEYGEYEVPRPPPSGPKPIRPMVDPEAEGEVDTTRYPQPKEATHKIRGRSDIIELLCGAVDQELLTVKTFYFFFYSAFGSLFPLMGVYFKQMGMNAGQCGLLIGTRPFVEFLSAPFWGSLADRWQKGKTLLLASLSAWIIFTLPLGFIQPSVAGCIKPIDEKKPSEGWKIETANTKVKREADFYDGGYYPNPAFIDPKLFLIEPKDLGLESRAYIPRRKRATSLSSGQSPSDISYAKNYNASLHKSWVSPLFSSIIYKTPDIQKAFFLLLLLVIIGEFFSAPAITLADSAVITLLGEDADRYGHQRMFGSLGWGLAMFFVGIALDHSTAFPEHPCGPERQEKNYTICFATFSVLMGAALITATQINFKYDYGSPSAPAPATTVEAPPSREEQLQSQLATQLQLPGLDTSAAPPDPGLVGQTKMFAQTTREIPEWVTVLKQFQNVKSASFLFVAWFMGFGIGLIFTFLFWHLQDIGGSPTLFGVASVINHISEIFAYFFSFKLITQMGHVKVLCLGLAGNVLRFLYISWLRNPWWVLPFEFVQGVTHAAVWAACCSYIAHGAPPHLRSSAQGVLQGIHHGLGRGCGAVIGGIFVSYFGTTSTFRGYGILCLGVLAAFVFINFYRVDTGGFVSDLPPTEDPHQVAEDSIVLAPHGVPSNPIPRALSSSRLTDLAHTDNYGATQGYAGGDNLGVPGQGPPAQPAPSNPFLSNGTNYAAGGGGGGGYR